MQPEATNLIRVCARQMFGAARRSRRYLFSASGFVVAQICNLPYRRFAIGNASALSNTFDLARSLQNAILRYGRLQICATLNRYQRRAPSTKSAFTIVELLVSVSIMTLIVFGLYQMFNQTQRALRNNITQVDVLESGRAALNMMVRELEQLTPSQISGATNLFVGMSPYPPLLQLDIDEKTPLRTNLLQEFFFVAPKHESNTRSNTTLWAGTGYRVIGGTNGVGTLYRFSVSTDFRFLNAANLSMQYMSAPVMNPVTHSVSTNFHRVADGIINLRLTAFDGEGRRMGLDTTNVHPAYRVLRQSLGQRQVPVTNNVIIRQDLAGQSKLIFLGNAVPAYLELEFGVLEPQTFVKYESMRDGSPDLAQNFLKKQAGKVHLFRQRIPIRTASQ